jgi:hypothetical protein
VTVTLRGEYCRDPEGVTVTVLRHLRPSHRGLEQVEPPFHVHSSHRIPPSLLSTTIHGLAIISASSQRTLNNSPSTRDISSLSFKLVIDQDPLAPGFVPFSSLPCRPTRKRQASHWQNTPSPCSTIAAIPPNLFLPFC